MHLSKLFPCFQFRLEDNINKLDYSNNFFSEGFPQVWQYERTLEELNVSSTRIKNLPPQLFYCQGLRVLLANNNSLENIPEAVGSLRQLQKLNLSRNFISNVPDNIKSCKSLTHLDLSCNSLQKLPDAITYLISLQELILNETYLEYLPANFGRLVNLRIVELRSNNLISLPKSIQRLTNLQRLDIGCNEFIKIPEVIGELKQLREFWFDSNPVENLPFEIGKLRELVHCEANGNRLTSLPNEIGNWRNLEVLSVSINNLKNLPFNFGLLKSLVILKCESNELIDLPDSISNLENLEELVVSHNKLFRLPNTIGMLKKLRYLFADDNNLQILPEEVCSCSLLTVLSVSQNEISKLPVNIGNLTNLKVLNVVQNKIVAMPVSLLSLRNLTSLWISNNQSKPLIPLQYTDLSTKNELTCFMLPQQKSTQINTNNSFKTEQLSDEVASCSISKRRICFAEETTVLNSNPPAQELKLSTSASKCFNNDSEIFSTGNAILPMNYGCFEQKDANLLSIEQSKDFLMRSPTPYPKDLRLMSKYLQSNQIKSFNSKNENPEIFDEEHYQKPLIVDCKNQNFKYDEENYKDGESLQNSLHQQQIDNMGNNLDTLIHTNIKEHFFVSYSTPKPPPYHIARCFTKKSVEDLTAYEFERKRQEQHSTHFENNQLIQQKDNSKNIKTSSRCEVNFDCENNLMIPHTKRGQEIITSKNEIIERPKSHENNTECIETSQTPNISTNKSKTKWLFGVHKNPRVIQVNISSEHNQDFEIDVFPNKEGIFIVSTISESCTSKVLHPGDKLLEVDGIDFSSITINEARQILNNCRPSISIMLSRK